MSKVFFFLFFFSLCFSSFAQNNITIKGKILEENTQIPLESATVYLSSVKDSTVIDYTISDKNGFFKFDTKKITTPFFLKISYMGYQTFKKEVVSLLESKDFGILHLSENPNNLVEVVIKSEVPPIRIKKDTLEFNASSFKVRPDANVETLLKQLPGVEIGTDGKITVNGKEVNQILVNGKPFFDKDGKIALQNLPSDIINKVQITDTKTKKEELTNQAASSNNASINLTIDEDKNKGFFGKFMGGFGTADRYESSALVNYFKNKRKISVLASSNNINSTGFSMDEIFDNMKGGRNTSFYYSDNGSFGIGSMRFGGGKGITRSNMVGVNYSDEWFKGFEPSGSYFFTNSNSENKNRSKQTVFLPTGNFTTESSAESDEENNGHNFNFQFEYKIDSTASIVISPKFIKSNSTYRNNSFEFSKDESNQLLNENTSLVFDESDKANFNNLIEYNKSFNKKGRHMSLSFENVNAKENLNSLNKTNTFFYQGSDPDVIRDQIRVNKNFNDKYTSEIEYAEPITDSLKIKIGADYSWQKTTEDRDTHDFNSSSQSYSDLNASLTNYFESNIITVKPKTGISLNKKKYNISLNTGISITQFDNESLYLNTKTVLSRNYVLPYAEGQISYKFTKSKSLWMSYGYDINFPTASQILPVENLANPLNTYIGNVDLDPNKSHRGYFSFRDYDYASRSGYSVYFGGDYFDSQVVSSTVFDANRKRRTTYENVSGTYSSWFGFNWNKSIKKDAHNFKFGFGLSANFGLSKGFTNGVLFEANTLRLTPRANFTYEYGELLTINPTYNVSFNDTKYTNYLLSSTSNVTHKFNIQTTNYWPKNWVFGNDFGYTFNSNIADGFKKDFYLWNTSLAYSFYNKKITAKVKVYDLLNQNQNATRTITPTAIQDEENIVLKRYLMFSLTYKLEKFAGKEKSSKGGHFMFF
ncbi:outer membrane beta-barrel protein [Flavobacterium sp. K5-23]|uniref:outer membrane beta-barrel protein n=1 Tax=Flavobacterium sp. K5-23 TaxID=2746225 RepID=UPI002010B2BB|nr:outer membrane beta-barrel protein [Flavobacterium sp. K5-23]UQD54997.1 outer membrane beta-barrel protein [Flavobacterium sp. K5-23]